MAKAKHLHQLSVEIPMIGAGRAVAALLYGVGTSLELTEHQMEVSQLITDRVIAAHENFTFEAHKILMSQIVLLEVMVSRHAQLLAASKTPETIELWSSILLRSQDQLRKTLLALNEIRNPKKPTQFIKNYVDKQLNQLRIEAAAYSQLEPSEHEPIDLSQEDYQPEPVRANSPVATLEEIDWT